MLQQRLETTLGPAYDVLTADAGDPAGRGAGPAVPRVLHRRAARLRGHRGGGRRVHHLQHLHDPGRAANAGARAAPGDGCDRRTGRAVGGARGLPRRRGGVGARVARRASPSGWACSSCCAARPRSARHVDRAPHPHDRGLARGRRRRHRRRRGDPRRARSPCATGRRHRRRPPAPSVGSPGASSWVWSCSRSACSRSSTARPRPRGHRRVRPGPGGGARRVRRARRGRDGSPRGGASVRRAIGAPLRRLGSTGHARPGEHDAQPASHRHHRVGTGHRARARRVDRHVRRLRAASVGRETGDGLRADYLVKTDGFSGFSADVAKRLRPAPGHHRGAHAVRRRVGERRREDGRQHRSADLSEVVDLGFVRGGAGGLDDGVLVADDLARHLGVDTGDQIVVQFSLGQLPLNVRGVYRRQNFIGLFGQSVPLLVAPETMASVTGGSAQDSLVSLRTDGGEDRRARRALVHALAADFPNVSVLTRDEFRADQQAAGRPVPHRAHRHPRPLGDHRHPRHREHARPFGVRTHS